MSYSFSVYGYCVSISCACVISGLRHLLTCFTRVLFSQDNDPSLIMSDVDETLESHQIVFAAEQSRLTGKVLQRNDDGEWLEV